MQARIADLCDVVIGRTPRRERLEYWGGTTPWVCIRDLNGGTINTTRECISDLAVREVMPRPVPAGTLLFSFKLTIGKTGLAARPLYTNEAIAALPIKRPDLITVSYLKYALEAVSAADDANHAVLGKVLNKEKVGDLRIKLPPLDEQQRIVDILDRAASIQRLRQAADEKLKQIIPALFVDMFGDPATNPKGWLTTRLGTHVEEFRYGTSQKSGATGLPVLRIPNVISDTLDTGEIKLVELNAAEQQRLLLRDGDLLFVRTNGNPDYVGRSAVFDRTAMDKAGFDGSKCVYASYLIRARLNAGLSPHFLQAYLTTAEGRKFLRERSKTSAGQYNINIDGLSSLPVYVPPISLQNLFCEKIAAIRATVGLAEKADTTGQLIAASLSAQLCNP